MIARVVGTGRETAGDDGVGIAVVRACREGGPGPEAKANPGDVEFVAIAEPSQLIPLLETPAPVVVVDAVFGPPPGTVLVLEPEAFEAAGASPLSTHGMGVLEAIALARSLHGTAASPSIRIVGIGIARPQPYHHGLSPEVAAAVPRAVEAIRDLLKSL